VIKPPLKGDGWLATTACCTPNLHRDLRVVVDGRRIETAETFAVDWALLKGDRVYEGKGTTNEQFYAYGADVFAVADSTVVSVQDGKPDTTPNVAMIPKTLSDFGGNQVMLEIAPKVYAVYGHLQPGSLRVKVGDTVKVGAPLAKIGNTGPSLGPHLHFGLLNRPDMFTGRSLPFVIDSYTLAGNRRHQSLARRHAGGDLEFEAGSFRLPALRRNPKFPVARPTPSPPGSLNGQYAGAWRTRFPLDSRQPT
jgi:murein DD-endopeptidase MepM/ murein hydrolase activator NlpD